jgi:hypothetical protein
MVCQACNTANRSAAYCVGCGQGLRRARGRPPWLRLAGFALALIAVVAGCAALAISVPRVETISQMPRFLHPRPAIATRDVVVTGMQSMKALATAKYTIQTIVAVEDRGYLGPLTADRILLRANADVLAGIDLGTITAKEIQANGDSVTIKLPAASLISKDVDFQVYDRRRGWLATTNKDLQNVAEQQARKEIIATACAKGILREAEANAQNALRPFVLNLGFTRVDFTATPPDAKACAP